MPELHWAEVLVRVVLAGILGGAIGAERELREREAGLRRRLERRNPKRGPIEKDGPCRRLLRNVDAGSAHASRVTQLLHSGNAVVMRQAIQPGQQIQGVDRVDGAEQRQRPPGLVRLQVANQVPFRVRQRPDLGLRFLDAVLAQDAEAGIQRGAGHRRRESLGDRHQPEALGVASGALRGGAQAGQQGVGPGADQLRGEGPFPDGLHALTVGVRTPRPGGRGASVR